VISLWNDDRSIWEGFPSNGMGKCMTVCWWLDSFWIIICIYTLWLCQNSYW
jgi:hypothetical protein